MLPKGIPRATLDLVIDRVVVREDQRSRIADSLELAFREGQDRVTLLIQATADDDWEEVSLSQNLAWPVSLE